MSSRPECRVPRCERSASLGEKECWKHVKPKQMARTRINPVNRKRRAAMKKKRDGPQAALCRTLPCAVCHRGPAEPHHYPTVANGGTDADTGPLCRDHHTLGGMPEAFHSTPLADWEAHHDIVWAEVIESMRMLVALKTPPGDPWGSVPF